jgi:glycosyltransferase involved in cell wall biosynthesis
VNTRQSAPFRLLYDLRWMELGRAGGIEQATYELVAAISQVDRRNRYHVLAPRSACHEWDFPRDFRVDLHYSDEEHSFEILDSSRGKRQFEVVHSVCGYAHPDLLEAPGILTMNDLQHLEYPQFFAPDDWNNRERLYRASAANARHIICISEFTRQDMHRRYGVALEKMSTVWIIPDKGAWRVVPERMRKSILAGMGLSEPFLLFPAHCWLHKNHARLVEAISLVDSSLPRGLKLILTGSPFPEDHPAATAIREYDLARRIVHLGYRSPLELRALYQGCLAVVFPSLFEGFGIPVAEGIISGKAVLCSNVTALPEIAGDAALQFDPMDASAMGARILEIATQPALRASLTAAALRRRAVFSARRSAVQTLAVYQRVAEDLRG